MIPYFTFMIITLWFILSITGAGAEPKEDLEQFKIALLASFTLILWFWQVLQEIIQFRNDWNSENSIWVYLWDYFSSLNNIGDIICLTLTPALCLTNYGDVPSMGLETQAYMGAIVAFLLVSKCFDWLRIFEDTSFYITLITNTIKDIGSFMVLFGVALGMFALPLQILNNINQ